MIYFQVITHLDSKWISVADDTVKTLKKTLILNPTSAHFHQKQSNFVEIQKIAYQPVSDRSFSPQRLLICCFEPFQGFFMKFKYFLKFSFKFNFSAIFRVLKFTFLFVESFFSSIKVFLNPVASSSNYLKIQYVTIKHFTAISNFLQSEHEWTLILEDDAKLVLEHFDIFSFINLIGNDDIPAILDLNAHFNSEKFFPGSRDLSDDVNGFIQIPAFFGTTCAYLINRAGAQLILDSFMNHINLIKYSSDWSMNLAMLSVKNFQQLKFFKYRLPVILNLSLIRGESSLGSSSQIDTIFK